MAQEYAILDKAATASETYLKDRLEHLDTLIEDIENSAAQKDAENKMLQKEIEVLRRKKNRQTTMSHSIVFWSNEFFFFLSQEIKTRIELEKDPNKDSVIFDLVDNQPQRMQRIRRRNRVISKIKEQEEVMLRLQEQLENYMHRSFPSLG